MTDADNLDVQDTWGARLVAAREAAGLSQTALAERLGVSLRTIVRWEAVGRDVADPGRRPDPADQRRLAQVLEVPVSDLLPRTDDEAEMVELVARLGTGCS